jgi:acyl carrier protein
VLRDVVEDSFALVELVIGLQEEFGVDLIHDDLQSIRTVGDLTQRLQERAAQS